MKEKNTATRVVDLSKPPVMTAEQKARLAKVAAMPDDDINYSDAPFRPDADWVKAAQFPSAKKQVTLRIDADVLAFFREAGSRYQSRINAVLRSYMNAHKG